MNSDETREALKIAISDAILGWDPTHGSLRQVKDALTAHERAVKAEALREAASRFGRTGLHEWDGLGVGLALNDDADRIEQEAQS